MEDASPLRGGEAYHFGDLYSPTGCLPISSHVALATVERWLFRPPPRMRGGGCLSPRGGEAWLSVDGAYTAVAVTIMRYTIRYILQ